MKYGITIPRKQATRVTTTAPIPISQITTEKDIIRWPPIRFRYSATFMNYETTQSHKYWLPVTAAQMAKAYIHHGPAYFDLHKDQSYERVPLT